MNKDPIIIIKTKEEAQVLLLLDEDELHDIDAALRHAAENAWSREQRAILSKLYGRIDVAHTELLDVLYPDEDDNE